MMGSMAIDRVKLLARAEGAERESKYLDFKSDFDVASTAAWCEVIKDIVALANSGGGIIVFGVADDGTSSGIATTQVLKCDIADITNRIAKYTGFQFADIEIVEITRGSSKHPSFLVSRTEVPIVFTKPGTYDAGGGKQKVAFSQGTVYFRHGAKSEPGNRDDLMQWRDQELARLRKTWLGGIRKVVKAPPGHTIRVVPGSNLASDHTVAATISTDPAAPKFVPRNAEDIWPYRQKDLIREVNQALGKDAPRMNPYDVTCIKQQFDVLRSHPEFAYKPHHLASPQYSASFVAWIVKQTASDPDFFHKTRDAYHKATSKK
jgi:hypothetical protein